MLAKLKQDFEAFIDTASQGAPDLGVPQGIAITHTVFITEKLAAITVGWDAVEGADGYDVEHEFGPDMNLPGMRLIEHVASNCCTIGGQKPFLVATDSPYTVAIYATLGEKRAAVPGVAQLEVPAYAPPMPAGAKFREPVAWAQGQVENESLVVQVEIGGPTGTTKAVALRHAKQPVVPQDQEVADSGAAYIVIDQATADELGLPNNGPAPMEGVGGAAPGYWTTCDLIFPGNGYRATNQRAAVLPSFHECLVGFDFPDSLGLVMCVDTARGVLSYFDASQFWAPPETPAAAG